MRKYLKQCSRKSWSFYTEVAKRKYFSPKDASHICADAHKWKDSRSKWRSQSKPIFHLKIRHLLKVYLWIFHSYQFFSGYMLCKFLQQNLISVATVLICSFQKFKKYTGNFFPNFQTKSNQQFNDLQAWLYSYSCMVWAFKSYGTIHSYSRHRWFVKDLLWSLPTALPSPISPLHYSCQFHTEKQ